MMIMGTTGSGKSNALHHLLCQIRARGDRALIVDSSGALVSRFFKSQGDALLNPFDARSHSWTIWGECRQPYEYEALTHHLIPQETQDPTWSQSARNLLAVTAQKLESDPQRSTQRLLDYALIRPLREVTAFYEGTLVGSFMNEASAKTANSVRLTLGAHLKSLSFFQESPNPFSVRQWVRKEKDQSWLFLSSTTSLKECLAPLFSLWMTSAYSTLQSLSESSSRRLWFVMDELPSLGMMPSLPGALAEVRKYGGCFILGLQSLPQVEALYGQALTQTLVGLCGNKMVFRDENPVSNERVSLFLGVQDIEETAEHISYGSHPVRDGVSLSKVMSVKRVVDPSDIAELPDLTCFVKFSGGNSAVSRLTLPYLSLPEIASPFQERELPAMNPRPSVPQTAENLPLHDLLETLLKSEGGKGSES